MSQYGGGSDTISELRYTKDGKVMLRKSMLEGYFFCPQQLNKVYVEGDLVEDNYVMSMGTRFHEFAFWFFDVCQGFDVDDWMLLVPDAFCEREKQMVEWFIDYEQNRFVEYDQDYNTYLPLHREIYLEDTDLGLYGTLDRMDRYKDGLCTVEYKTGKSFMRDSIVRQLSFYKLIYDNTIKYGEVKYMKYINPKLGVEKIIEFTDEMKDDLIYDITIVRNAINTGVMPRKCFEKKRHICGKCGLVESGCYKRYDAVWDYDD